MPGTAQEVEPYWPLYNTGPDRHIHALGVIAINYNLYENSLFSIFAHPLLFAGITGGLWSSGISYEECQYLFWSYDNAERVAAIRFFYSKRETEPAVLECIDWLLKHWDILAEKRHLLMHSELEHIPHNELLANLLSPEQAVLKLAKQSRDDWTTVNVMRLSLRNLRGIADDMHAGYLFAQNIARYLLRRDAPQPREGGLGGLGGFLLEPPPTLPEKPRIPRKLKMSPRPQAPEAEPPQPEP
jgi:hypothetical protein